MKFAETLAMTLFHRSTRLACFLVGAGLWHLSQLHAQQVPRPEQVPPGIPLNRGATANTGGGNTAPQVDLSIRPISSISLNIAPRTQGDLPVNLAAEQMRGELPMLLQDRPYEPWNYYWTATAFAHQPLYFEEVNVERYGHNAGCLQPAFSMVHFFGTIPILPYKMGQDHPRECVYTLGHSRPGDCAAWKPHDLRWSTCGAIAQGAVTTGLVFLIP
jgi:hypothetical protein